MTRLDDLLRQPTAAPGDALERAWRVAQRELSRPRISWKREVLKVVGATWASASAMSGVLLATGNVSLPHVVERLSTVAPLVLLGGVGAWAALAPGRRRLRWAVVIAGLAAAGSIVALRQPPSVQSAYPQWICMANHLALGLGPLWLLLSAFRSMAPSAFRSAVGGLAVGTVGAIAGEVGCDQSWQHVLLFHVTTWVMVTAAAVIVARRLRRTSFAR